MNTSEVLQAVQGIMPKLDEQTLYLWRKKGYLGRPKREGLGCGEGLTENEWPADTVDRIKIIGEVTRQRATDKAAKALIAKGYFIGPAEVRAQMMALIGECDESAKFGEDGYIPKNRKYPLVDVNTFPFMNVIASGLTLPRQFFPYIAADDAHHVALGYELSPSDKLTFDFTRLIDCFSLDNLSQYLTNATPLEIEQAFNNAANIFNYLCPIIAHYLGREGYPPVTNTRFDYFLKKAGNGQLPNIPQYEFDCMIRLFCVFGCLAISKNSDEIGKRLPRVITEMVKAIAPHKLVEDENGEEVSIPIAPLQLFDELHAHHTAYVETKLKIMSYTDETTNRLEAKAV